jgi:hypothetical protein
MTNTSCFSTSTDFIIYTYLSSIIEVLQGISLDSSVIMAIRLWAGPLTTVIQSPVENTFIFFKTYM